MLLAACKGQAVNLDLRLFPDGSGEVSYYGVYPREVSSGPPGEKEAEFKGVRDVQRVSLRVEAVTAAFDDVNKCDFGGITCQFEKLGDGSYRIVMVIPTTPDAAWCKRIGLSEEEIKNFEALRKLGRDRFVEDEKQALSVLFSVQPPGPVRKHEITNLRELPEGWRLEKGLRQMNLMGDDSQVWRSSAAMLYIPVRDLARGEIKQVTWEIRSGRELPETRRAWEEFRKRHALKDKDE